ncbi:MAG: dihydrolipoamide dehydrogenase [Candidatus Nitrosomirales archaeon]|jgi:dihydrolipoamide dehydrogenase
MEKYDLIVIGAGSGLTVASKASSMGMKTALVEKGPMGGTCLNRGCIPSKALLHAADIMATIHDAGRFGIHVKEVSINFEEVMNWMKSVIQGDAEGIEEAIEKDENTSLYKLEGKFVEDRVMKVGKEEITADKIVIAAGIREFVPPIKGLERTGYLTSTTLLNNKKQPRSLAIIGGGYVGCEYAHFFARLGTEVTVIQRNKLLVPNEDMDISLAFTDYFGTIVNVLTNSEAMEVEKTGDQKIVHIYDAKKKEEKILAFDEILVAAGRVPNTDILAVENTGVKTDRKGFVIVDYYLKTSHKDVWAFGDIIGRYMFKHVANYEAEYVVYNALMGKNLKVDYSAVPHAIFTYPQIAGVGMTEREARAKNMKIKIGRYDYKKVGKAAAIGEEFGFGKSIIDADTNRILGFHMIGRDAAEIVHEAIVAMNSQGANADTLLRSIHIHPTLAEVVPGIVGNIQDT